jgi:hypothetical protein
MGAPKSTPPQTIGGAGTKTGERRNSYRQPTSAAALLHLYPDADKARTAGAAGAASATTTNSPDSVQSASIPIHLFDLSMYDVGFSAVTRLAIGQVCRLEVPNGRSGSTLIQIRSVRSRPDGLYDVGGRFC